jgi:predicted nuclease of restriction endonuclease-like (RecB) superfamily
MDSGGKAMDYLSESRIYENIRTTVAQAQQKVYSAVNFVMVETYWNIGKQIYEAQGENPRAEYGAGLMKFLSEKLTEEFGRGFTVRNLSNMRSFYITFSNWHAVRTNLSWTHYRLLINVEDNAAREFYLDECARANWSTRQLERQINSFYYQRILSSQDKDGVRSEIRTLEKGPDAKDIIRDPYVLEFLGLQQTPNLYEKDLEQGLIDHLQKFLLELGRGFSFVARQKRISFDGEHYFIDLVFYNYILKCFVLIDLKVGKLTHQDIGQMQMYVNYYTREMMNEGDSRSIGIILCADKSESVVRYTLPEGNNQIFASKYKLYMPTEEELKRELEKEQELLEIEQRL